MAKKRINRSDGPTAEQLLGSVPPPEPKRPSIEPPKGWGRAQDVLERITSVQTRFPDFNRGVRVGGLPLKRFHTVTGPSAGGKSAFMLGVLESFLAAGHYGYYVDAEHATPEEFVTELMGELEQYPTFFASRPKSYEQTIDAVEQALKAMVEVRKKDPTRACIVLVDSINALVPERELKATLKAAGTELTKGHGARYRAAINNAWIDSLVPRLADANAAVVAIAVERDAEDGIWGGGDDYVKVKGGKALLYSASLLIRVSKGVAMRDPPGKAEDGTKGEVVGWRHYVRIHKSKVSHMDGAYTQCAFHLSNGKLTPPGFDLARDVFETGKTLGLIKQGGSFYGWGKKRWQGEVRAVTALANDQPTRLALLHEIAREIKTARGPEPT